MERPDHMEDISTIGGDWDNESANFSAANMSQTQQQQDQDNAGFGGSFGDDERQSQSSPSKTKSKVDDSLSLGEMGDMDVDDIQADKERYFQEHAMIVDGFKCPDEFIEIITPMEFEEMVNLFQKFDANNSGTIDKHETKRILHYLGMDFSIEKAEEMLMLVDKDGSGEIEFDEFCHFIAMIKRGDERMMQFGSILDKLNSTPLGELERQAKMRNLKIGFEVVEVRAASATNPTIYVVETQLTGVWHRVEAGEILSHYATKRFQGFGENTREAKYNAATAAVLNLGDAMPGVKFAPGEFSEEWYQWIDDNLLRGVDPGKIVAILSSKGFQPHRNTVLMHRILAWHSLQQFQQSHPYIDLTDTTVKMHEEFLEWIRHTALQGIDGEVLHQLLEDRYIELSKEHLHFAQKLRYNELGCLISKNGIAGKILDFYHACACGYEEFVLIYCKCGVPVNEAVLDRHTGERMRALTYAAMGGHAQVCRILLEYGAEVNALDVRGRNAVHIAALNGHRACCEVLIDHGGRIFGPDLHGNSPLHLAAMKNSFEVVDYLAYRGQDLARIIYSDKTRARKSMTFDQFVAEIFEKLPEIKLSQAESRRFEKAWLHDAAMYFLRHMDADVKYMVPRSCVEIMEDVLARFDPRPETGIVVTNEVTGDQDFIKTIPQAADLSVLLKYIFRQSAVDMINRWHRTALHMACDANVVNSHEKLIVLLIDVYGCNVNLRDMHKRRAIELLIQDKVIRNAPTSTQVREETLMARREENLNEFFVKIGDEDHRKTIERRADILNACIAREDMMDSRLWSCLRQASLFKKCFRFEWEMYEDPDTGNYFYCRAPQKKVTHGDGGYAAFSWVEPKDAKHFIDRHNALQYLMHVKSRFLRKYGAWEVFRCKRTLVEFYYNAKTEELRFHPPAELQWKAVLRESRKTPESLGYAQEWLVYEDKYRNKFYRNKITRYCEYDRPIDAKEMIPAEKLCSAYQFKNQAVRQKWYSCEQCNRAWKLASAEKSMSNVDSGHANNAAPQTSGAQSVTKSLVVCEPCIARCHANHKGVRFLYTAYSSKSLECMCMSTSSLASFTCNACIISDLQIRTQRDAENMREELKRTRQRNFEYPPIFACVPRLSRANKDKVMSGWYICRVCKPAGRTRDGEDGSEEDESSSVAASELTDDSDASQSDSERSRVTKATADSSSKRKKQKVPGTATTATATVAEELQPEESVASSLEMLMQGKEAFTEQQLIAKKGGVSESKQDSAADSSSAGWVEVYDVEEPEELKFDDVVLCMRYSGYPKLQGKVRAAVKPGFYRVRYDDKQYGEEVLERSHIELVSRSKFYFNVATGQSSWSKEDALSAPFESQALVLNYRDWMEVYQQSTMRRGFEGEYDEMYHAKLDVVFYVHHDTFVEEKSVLKLQTLFRAKHFKKRPYIANSTAAFSFDIPSKVWGWKKVLAGWAYLRRRARNVGEFQDVDGYEWEEYMDNQTSEYFYWQEDENQYRWEKPPLFQRKKFDHKDLVFKEGDDVMFLFPGRRAEEVAVVRKVRYDDETGEPMYDVQHKYTPELYYKWIPRVRVKTVPLEGEEIKLAKLEQKWRTQIKRRREADERQHQREKESKMKEEMEALDQIKSKAFQLAAQRQNMMVEDHDDESEAPVPVPEEEEEVPRMIENSANDDADEAKDATAVVAVEKGDAFAAVVSAANKPSRPMTMQISNTTRLMRGRMERINLESQIVREEIDAREGQRRRDRVQQEIDNMRQQFIDEGGKQSLTRAAILSLQRTMELKLLLEDKVEQRNKLQVELQAKKEQTERRIVELENFIRDREVIMTTPRSLRRRKVVRRTHIAMKRQSDGFIICEWGCGDWFRVGIEQQDHQLRRCVKRIIPCTLGCPLKHTEEHWLSTHSTSAAKIERYQERKKRKKQFVASIRNGSKGGSVGTGNSSDDDDNSSSMGSSAIRDQQIILDNRESGVNNIAKLDSSMDTMQKLEADAVGTITVQQYHETQECPKRLVICPLQCLEWICAEILDYHMNEVCTKRPAKPIPCRLGCGLMFGGRIENLIEAEDSRAQHENEECDFRIVRCNWCYDDGKLCAAQVRANERTAHRDYHLQAMGVSTYAVPGVYTIKTEGKPLRMKVQIWGGGGGSGYFFSRQGGEGGGGAFMEAIIDVEPYTVLELTVGGGGAAGVRGTAIKNVDIHELRKQAKLRRAREVKLSRLKLNVTAKDLLGEEEVDPNNDAEASKFGTAAGGQPGGGEGYAGNDCWACGGGGGYTCITKKTKRGTQLLLLAGGGGGGGSVPGLPGGGLTGVQPGTLLDPINGCTATVDKPGAAGDSGSTYNAQWPASAGQQWQGGNGCEFGAGGGGGYFGGGGGGTSPGIGGGGGGGSSYVFENIIRDVVIIMGHGRLPGGIQHQPPQACGVGEWDKLPGHVGEGGRADAYAACAGNNGCIRIFKTGFY